MSKVEKIEHPKRFRIRAHTRRPRTEHRITSILHAKDYISKFNMERTDCASHAEVYYDESGNKRVRYVPYALHFEALKGGLCFYIVDPDGKALVPLNPFDPVPYKATQSALELLGNYHRSMARPVAK